MITIVSGSNRPNNFTSIFARYAFEYLKTETGGKCQYLDLLEVDPISLSSIRESQEKLSLELQALKEQYFLSVDKFWFFVPEYNGSIPGVFKLFLDVLSLHDLKPTFSGKKACITGTATGRAGNLRGMDHLADILNHLNVTVMPNKLPVSSIHKLIDDQRVLKDEETVRILKKQALSFMDF